MSVLLWLIRRVAAESAVSYVRTKEVAVLPGSRLPFPFNPGRQPKPRPSQGLTDRLAVRG